MIGASGFKPHIALLTIIAGAATAAIGVTLGGLALPDAMAQTASQVPPRSPVEALAITAERARVTSGQKFFGDASYVGSESCKSCHQSQYEDWSVTWHAKMERLPSPDVVVGDFNNRTITYKDIKVKGKDGKEETLTFEAVTSTKDGKYYFTMIDKDNPANNQTYQIAKTLGGKWDQHYEVKIGENYLPAPIRWSVEAKDWLISSYNPFEWVTADGTPDGRPLRPEELPKERFAEAKCAGCHTTGFEFYKDASVNHWKARGNGEIGIACERCHGPASKHVAEAKDAAARGDRVKAAATTIVHPLRDLDATQQIQVCSQCHGRNTHKTISELAFQTGFKPGDVDMTSRARFWSYSGTSNPDEYKYFWPNDWANRNRQQWQDFSKSKHFTKADMSCITCHTFHGKAEDAQLRQKSTQLCVGCHTASGYSKRPNAEMFAGSPMAKAGVQCVDCHMPKLGYRSDKTSKGPHPWDVSAHTFMVALPKFEVTQGIRSSCASCHEGQGRTLASGVKTPPMAAADLDLLLKQRQEATRTSVTEVQGLLQGILSKDPAAKRLVDEASGKLGLVLLDGSLGFHNQERGDDLIAEARALAERAAAVK